MSDGKSAAVEGVLPFDPQWFRSDYRVTRWEPGRVVQFDKSLSLTGTAFAMFLFLFGGAWGWAGALLLKDGLRPTSSVPHPIAAALVLAALSVLPAAFGLVVLREGFPRHVRLDWAAGTITTGWLWKTEAPLSGIIGLELIHVHRSGSSNRGRARAANFFWCELEARLRAEAGQGEGRLFIVETEHREGDSSGPYRQMLPLAADLATALGVTHETVSRYL
jgi:hypothetical protein